jgi:DNA-binding transcriptional MerR regulator
MKSAALRIGEVAARSGVSVDTVRFYERRRLLPRAARTEGGFRLFAPETVGRVKFIKQAQDLGFSLDEIGEFLATGGAQECRRVRDALRAKLAGLDERVRLMREFRRTLSRHLAACEQELEERGDQAQCPVLVNLSGARTRKEVKR